MEDIARIAGVSKSAISIAFSGKPGISAETRAKILAIAQEHGYSPRPRTTTETVQRSLTFLAFTNSGIVLEQYYQQPFFKELIHYIEVRCRARGFTLIFSSIDTDNFEQNMKSFEEESRSDGVIILGTNLSKRQLESTLEQLHKPVVVLDNYIDTLKGHFIAINNLMGADQAVAHLIELGHKSIGYIASDIRIQNFEERYRGFRQALQEREISYSEELLFHASPTVLTAQPTFMEQLEQYKKKHGEIPSALFCECDYLAISAVKALSELGYQVPRDISIIGFDNISESVIVTPELSTIHVEKEKLAYLAVDLLADTLAENTTVATKIIVDTHLVTRLSTAPPLLIHSQR